MLIDTMNLNLLRVFECVFRNKSMTKAAEELHMTQSGVSQNIKHLEEILQVRLFDRVKQRPVATDRAKTLYKSCSKNLYGLEEALVELTGEDRVIKGQITIGLPIEYGNNVILPLLAKWGGSHPEVAFKIRYGHASEMNQQLLKGELDFAFVDSYGLDKEITTEKVADEILTLCASKGYLKSKGPQSFSKKYFEGLEYIDYVEETPILKSWFGHHLKIENFTGVVRASLMDVDGMSRMIVAGLGAGILPLHVVNRLKSQGQQLHLFKGSGKPLTNSISVAYLKGRTRATAVNSTLEYLMENLQKR
ncbi:MAG: LysR family transcriptional regulator [Halobacteriovoraceae bacterium]|jgi:DNA-binding transcriptional LysR family regulator|nr:LysR family transcriptional regulator [Halobacteriovoraceae bacterium]MBT5094708.1 LysR family transcriptional regulator [Halobacteriovoraceae bacterium]